MQIRIRHPDGQEDRIQLDPNVALKFGTRRSADVILRGAGVFPLHCGIVYHREAYKILASDRARKISVNGKRVRRATLCEGDTIQLGDTLIEVVASASDGGSDGLPVVKTGSGEKKRSSRGRRSAKKGSKSRAGKPTAVRLDVEPLENLDDAADLLSDVPDDPLGIDDLDVDLAEPTPDSAPTPRQRRMGTTWIGRLFRSTWFKVGLAVSILIPIVVLTGVYIYQLPSAEQQLDEANVVYHRGDFDQAIKKYDHFLKWHADEPLAIEARVNREVAALLRGLDGGIEASTLLDNAKEAIVRWGSGSRQAMAQWGLAEVLVPLAGNLIRDGEAAAEKGADEAAKKEFTRAAEALALIYQYVPPQYQAEYGVDEIQIRFTRLERELDRPAALDAALTKIQAAGSEGGIDLAYSVRNRLLGRFPKLAHNGRLRSAMKAVGRSEPRRVKTAAKPVVPRDAPAETVWSTQVVVTSPDTTRPAAAKTQTAAVLVRDAGAAWAFDVGSGRTCWRYPVGFETDTTPIAIGRTSMLFVDSRLHEVVRVTADTGKTQWRLSTGPLAGSPVLNKDRALIAAVDGRVMQVEIESGRVAAQVELPQRLCIAPVLDPTAPRVYQVADHSMIYVLSRREAKCLSAHYIGHERNTVTLPAIVFEQLLIVCEFTGSEQTQLHVLRCGDELTPVQTLALDARVTGKPISVGNVICLPCAGGNVRLFRYSESDARRPVRTAGEVDLAGSQGAYQRPLQLASEGGKLWVAGQGVTVVDVAPPSGPPRIAQHIWKDVRVTQPLQFFEDHILIVDDPADRRGIRLTTRGRTDRKPRWSCRIAQTPASPPLVSQNQADVWAQFSDGVIGRASISRILESEETTQFFRPVTSGADTGIRRSTIDQHGQATPCGSGGVALRNGATGVLAEIRLSDSLSFIDFAAKDPTIDRLPLPAQLACAPVNLGDRLLVALSNGLLCQIDVARRQLLPNPWLPSTLATRLPNWRTPAVLQDGRVVAFDGQSQLYLLRQNEALRSFDVEEQVELNTPILSGLAAIGGVAWGVDANRQLVSMQADRLGPSGAGVLGSDVFWGPAVMGDHVFVATTGGDICCLGENANPSWIANPGIGPLVGVCSVPDGRIVCASRSGRIGLLDTRTGKLRGQPIETDQALAYGPIRAEQHLAVMTEDGCLLVLRPDVSARLGLVLRHGRSDKRAMGGTGFASVVCLESRPPQRSFNKTLAPID